MRPYLVFRIEAPLASFGTIAVGERRPTWDRPSKSQVIGLLAAALGIERTDEPRQAALAAAIALAVRVDDPGALIQDYHTVQQPAGPAVRRRLRAGGTVATRAEELDFGPGELETTLSRREYRRDAAYTIAVWLTNAGAVTLEDLAKAIAAPNFILAAGRRANALMFPCGPLVTSAEPDVLAAFAAYDAGDEERRAFRNTWTPPWLAERRATATRTLYADETVELPATAKVVRHEQRRDIPRTRQGWRFGLRTEKVIDLPSPEESHR